MTSGKSDFSGERNWAMAAQLHGVETAENVKRIKQEVRTVFKAVSAGS